MPGSEEMSVSTIHQLISDPARREVIYRLGTQEPSETLQDWDLAESIASKSDSSTDDVYASLRHRHLPQLDKNDAIVWDDSKGMILRGRFTATLFEYLTEVEDMQID